MDMSDKIPLFWGKIKTKIWKLLVCCNSICRGAARGGVVLSTDRDGCHKPAVVFERAYWFGRQGVDIAYHTVGANMFDSQSLNLKHQ